MSKNKKRSTLSYTSADSLPLKLLYNTEIQEFKPVHIQWLPTNRCNLNCPSCSCKQRNKSLEMKLSTALDVIENFAEMGTKAVTITGGGEPLMHPYIVEMIKAFARNNIKIGLVTNGLRLKYIPRDVLELLTWCRISSMDDRSFSMGYAIDLAEVVKAKIDWAFSHVVTPNPNFETIKSVVEFANRHGFTHVRLVADLLTPDQVDSKFTSIRQHLKGLDEKVIYQPRNKPESCHSCMIGYIKPLVAADFKMYLCCGVQYALKEKSLDLPEELSMGTALGLDKIYNNIEPQKTACVACYYTQYNHILSSMFEGLDHKEFV